MTDRSIAAIVAAPEVILTETDLAGDALLHFYRALGWNGVDTVDPTKVRTTKEVYHRLYAVMCEKCPNREIVGMAMVNKGPGVDDHIPAGMVYLLNGWTVPAEN